MAITYAHVMAAHCVLQRLMAWDAPDEAPHRRRMALFPMHHICKQVSASLTSSTEEALFTIAGS